MRTVWTDELIESELRKIADGLGKFPSVSDLKNMKRNDLSCQITKKKGMGFWATKLGFTVKSDSHFGWSGELEVSDIIISRGYCVESTKGVKAPYDLLVDDCVRVDVKTAKYAEYGPCRGWFYRLGKSHACDVVALFQFDTKSIYFLPWFRCPTTNVTISVTGGIYKNFKDKFLILDSFISGYKHTAKILNDQFI